MTTRQRPQHDPRSSPERLAERVVLVDANDREVGSEEKLKAHELGVLHRAVSVFLFDDHDRVLLQRRAARKYHSPGLWSNTCCGHPRPGESAVVAARRRLGEELGIESMLSHAFAFTYRAELGGGLIEHELDHVFTGRFSGTPSPDRLEVEAWGWMSLPMLCAETTACPERFTAWLPIALSEVVSRGISGR